MKERKTSNCRKRHTHTKTHSNHFYTHSICVYIAHQDRHLFAKRVLNKKQNAKDRHKVGRNAKKQLKSERNKLKLTVNNELLLKYKNAKWVH